MQQITGSPTACLPAAEGRTRCSPLQPTAAASDMSTSERVNVWSLIGNLVPYFGTQNRYGLKNPRKKEMKTQNKQELNQMEHQDAPGGVRSYSPGGQGETLTSLHVTPSLESVSWFLFLQDKSP